MFDVRRQAFEILLRVAQGGYADRCLDEVLRRRPDLDPRDRGLLTELVYGVLRYQGRLDFALGHVCKLPLSKLENRVLLALRLGAYQILCLDRIPAAAAVDTSVGLMRQLQLERATGFVNGVLRALVRGQERQLWPDPEREPLEFLQHRLSLPAWLAARWFAELGSEAMVLAEALLQPAPFTLRVNTLKTSRDRLLSILGEAGHQAEATRFAPEGLLLSGRGSGPLPGDSEGLYQVQDQASMLIAHLVEPQPGERLLDCCAAPGGKTTHLAALCDNRAEIVALDLHPHRVRLIEQGARRLGCQGITARAWDMTVRPDFLAPESFDAVLVDAPCSGLGVLRRNPETRWRLQPDDLPALQGRQTALLVQAAALVRPGGRLIYSVCTMTNEETDQVVERFLDDHPQFVQHPLTNLAPAAWMELLDERGILRSWPHRHGLDGFFAVRMHKEGFAGRGR